MFISMHITSDWCSLKRHETSCLFMGVLVGSETDPLFKHQHYFNGQALEICRLSTDVVQNWVKQIRNDVIYAV